MNAPDKGLFKKFIINRIDGRDGAGDKHDGCEYFVLDLTHDKHAIPAIAAYAESCEREFPALANDLRAKVANAVMAQNEFITVPETTLPNGTVVPSFQVARYLSSKGPAGVPASNAANAPWVKISYHEAHKVCESAGMKLITETQALAIAWNISQQEENWSGGKIGKGKIYMGIHKGDVDESQAATYESSDSEERRWHVLSNGERIYDMAGNAFTWVFDDVQGDDSGLVADKIAANSISLTTAPFPSMKKGMGYRPDGARSWSGDALVRGGCWGSGGGAGVFYLNGGWPGDAIGVVGFRCTK